MRIIIYFVDDMIYVLSIFSYFYLSKMYFWLEKFPVISFQFYSGTFKKKSVSTFSAFHVISSGSLVYLIVLSLLQRCTDEYFMPEFIYLRFIFCYV